MSSNKPLTYKDAGVDIDAGNALVDRIKPLVAKTHRPEVMAGLGGFGGLFALGDRYRDPVLVSGTDGVGTKLLLAKDSDALDTIGIDLVAMCVNDILVCGAEPLFFLDYFACGQLQVDHAARVVQGIAGGCQQAGCALIGGETAEMPDMYAPGEFDLAGFAVGAIERDQMITGQHITAGNHIVGIGSSGPHSNGYSLIRKLIEMDPGALAPTPAGQRLKNALMAPTQIYARAVLDVVSQPQFTPLGMAHITGGGLTENITRVIPDELGIQIDARAWPSLEVFDWMMATGSIAIEEMRRTFNMGIGFVLIVPAEQSSLLVDFISSQHALDAWLIGEVVPLTEAHPRVDYVNN
ncbi:MAG: phosphoribosylformylglycinamidine cyclo-ligase [Wenzhouxiangella sp.]|nr:phosphoribosylformylglycinamidine cyclo-ligase [Wenzhouxiangella sp.]